MRNYNAENIIRAQPSIEPNQYTYYQSEILHVERHTAISNRYNVSSSKSSRNHLEDVRYDNSMNGISPNWSSPNSTYDSTPNSSSPNWPY